MASAALSTVALRKALGYTLYVLNADGTQVVEIPNPELSPETEVEPPTINLLEVPAEVAAHGYHSFDLSIYNVPSIERSYLVELRSAFEESNVELFQLLIDTGEVASTDREERSTSLKQTKRWIEIANELGASGVRYVPGDSEPNAETIRLSAEAFRELADYAEQCGLKPATENYRFMNNVAEDLLQILELSEREYGLVADFGNAKGSKKYDTLAKLLPRATSIHAWAEANEDGTPKLDEFRHCLTMARDTGFNGPIMLHGAYLVDNYGWAPDFWSGVDELRREVQAVFGESCGGRA